MAKLISFLITYLWLRFAKDFEEMLFHRHFSKNEVFRLLDEMWSSKLGKHLKSPQSFYLHGIQEGDHITLQWLTFPFSCYYIHYLKLWEVNLTAIHMEPIKDFNVCIICSMCHGWWMIWTQGADLKSKLTLHLSEIGTIQQAAETKIKYY